MLAKLSKIGKRNEKALKRSEKLLLMDEMKLAKEEEAFKLIYGKGARA